MNSRDTNSRRNVAGVFAIVLGLALGLFIKRVAIGLFIGILLGFAAYSLFTKR